MSFSATINLGREINGFLKKLFLMLSQFCFEAVHSCLIGESNDTPLQYSCLENLMDRGAW